MRPRARGVSQERPGMYFEVVPIEIPPVVLWLGAFCLIVVLSTLIWMVFRSSRKNQGERGRRQ
jgi:hypothetical protein